MLCVAFPVVKGVREWKGPRSLSPGIRESLSFGRGHSPLEDREMCRISTTLAVIIALAASATVAQAAVTVTQDGTDLYVVGDNTNDSVVIANVVNQGQWAVRVTDNQTNEEDFYYNVDEVWVDTGNGDDYVQVGGAFTLSSSGADITVDTGNGKDEVKILAYYYGNCIDVRTGNGDDYVYASSNYSHHYGGGISIDAGKGDDEVFLWCLNEDFDISLGQGNDLIWGIAEGCYGVIDGGKGDDSCSELTLLFSMLSLINFED
jgi:hypothetical protein